MKKFYILPFFTISALFGFDMNDPFAVSNGVRYAPKTATQNIESQKPLSLAQLIDIALSNNPNTAYAWANALSKAQSVGAAKSGYLPQITATGGIDATKQSQKGADSFVNTKSGSIALSYTLYDFGAREANLQNAKMILEAANLSQNAQIQSTVLSVTQAYYNLLAYKASLESFLEAERSAKESFAAAEAKYKAGTATPADKLQAKTAYSQATLNRQKAEGALQNGYGELSFALGFDAVKKFDVEQIGYDFAVQKTLDDAKRLIEEGKKTRPDLAAAAMQIEAAKAGIDIAKASGRPTLSLSSSTGYSDTSIGAASRSSSASVQLSIPIFTGFSSTYKIEAAKVEAKLRELDYQKLEKQIALDVYKAYNNLGTQAVAVESSMDLLASAEESYKNASGRYKAGVGTILDLLTAQNSLASAKQQRVEAAYNWLIAKATLAYALGKLTTENLENGK